MNKPQLAVATDPIGLLEGRYALSASYVATRRVALRTNIEIYEEQPLLPGSDGWKAAVSLPIYLDRPLRGPFVEPGLALVDRFMGYQTVGIGTLGDGSSGGLGGVMQPVSYVALHARSFEPQIFVGWQWLFASRLHVAGAVGVSRHFATDGSGTSYSIPESYLRIGIAI